MATHRLTSKYENATKNDGDSNAENRIQHHQLINEIATVDRKNVATTTGTPLLTPTTTGITTLHSPVGSKVTQLAAKFGAISMKHNNNSYNEDKGGGRNTNRDRRNRFGSGSGVNRRQAAYGADDDIRRIDKTICLFEIDSSRVLAKTSLPKGGAHAHGKVQVDDGEQTPKRTKTKDNGRVNVKMGKRFAKESDVGIADGVDAGDAAPVVDRIRSERARIKAKDEITADVDGCFRMKNTQIYASYDVSTLKNRPLSLAHDFRLENVLKRNDDETNVPPPPLTPSAESSQLVLNKNRSFLHRSKNYDWSRAIAECDARREDFFSDKRNVNNVGSVEKDDSCEYSNIDELNLTAGEASPYCANVYDTVIYSEVDKTRSASQRRNTHRRSLGIDDKVDDELAAYEVVSSILASESGRDDDGETESESDSDVSLEKTNSLYEMKETAWRCNCRNGCAIHNENGCAETDADTDTNTVATVVTTNSGASVVSDDWTDVNGWESCDESFRQREKIIIAKKRIRFDKLRKFRRKKFRSRRNERNANEISTIFEKIPASTPTPTPTPTTTTVGNFSEELCDDFDDTSPEEGEFTPNESPAERPIFSNVAVVQSQNIYEFMKKARKTMRKSLSSLNQIRKNSLHSVTASLPNPNRTEAQPWRRRRQSDGNSELAASTSDANAAFSSTVYTRSSRTASVKNGGGGSMRWTSFKTKLRPKYRTVSAATNSTSIFYLNPQELRFGKVEHSASDGDGSGPGSPGPGLDPSPSPSPSHIRIRGGGHANEGKSTLIRRRTTTSLDLSRSRPNCPPPPPPTDCKMKLRCTENSDASKSHSNYTAAINTPTTADIDSADLNSVISASSGAVTGNVKHDYEDAYSWTTNHADVRANTATDARLFSDNHISPYSSCNSYLDVSSCSDLQLRFADEPLYQFYAESVAQLIASASLERYANDSSSDGYEEIGSLTSRPSAMDLITPSPNGHGQCRSLWCEVAEVQNSGILETLDIGRQKLQEAKFEVITSEASYYKSLSVLDKLFVNDARMRDEKFLCKSDWKILFGNVAAVRKCSQMLLSALENCWQNSIMLTGLSDVIYEHASANFKIYVKYCSNQIYIDRTLKKLREDNVNFVELVNELEADPVCQSLSLHSFLMLPMQRITRMPLLVDAIVSKLDPVTDHSDYAAFKITLATLNKIAKDCNENARKFERYEEMLLLSRQLDFSRKEVKMFSVASSSRWLIRCGPLIHLNASDAGGGAAKLTFTRKLTKQGNKLHFFLFNDVLVIAKKKSEDYYAVVDHCLRNVMQMTTIEDAQPSSQLSSSLLTNAFSPSHRYLLLLTILENHEGRTIEMVLSCDSDSTRQRWLEASSSHLASDNPEEKLYEEWDCPQVLSVHPFSANQPDELSLQNGDVVKVLKKTTDGWYHGERIPDGNVGWFPGNHTVEIASQHTRAKNLKLRHRLLTLSANYLQTYAQK